MVDRARKLDAQRAGHAWHDRAGIGKRQDLTPIAIFAATAPSLLAFNPPPSPTFLNQALAIAGWGLFVAAVGGSWRRAGAAWPLLLVFAGVAVGALISWQRALPASLALSALGMLAAAALVAASGAAARADTEPGHGSEIAVAFWIGLAVAGAVNLGIGLVQVFLPALPDGDWIARSTLPGRAVGNLRQPNHLSSLLTWSLVAVVALAEGGQLRQAAARAFGASLVAGIVLTASRTGFVSVLLLAAWGLLDRQRTPATRRALLAAPLVYAACWLALALWAAASGHVFGGEERLAAADISSSRFGIWGNTLALIASAPWTGVGFGEFNLAWTLTPFPGRPTAFFDHTHNLPLQLAVELGIPAATLLTGLLLWALWLGWRRSSSGAGSADARCAWMVVLMIGLHSLLEYPLWYAYFLLPAAWAFGFALARPGRTPQRAEGVWPVVAGAGAGAVMVVAAVAASFDYARVARIFDAGDASLSLAGRIADGRRSVLFSHHADYAAATTGAPQPDGQADFDGAKHYLLDTRLMQAWAQAVARAGDLRKARYLAARLREFGAEDSAAFFAACADATPQDWMCQPPRPGLTWLDFLGPTGAKRAASTQRGPVP